MQSAKLKIPSEGNSIYREGIELSVSCHVFYRSSYADLGELGLHLSRFLGYQVVFINFGAILNRREKNLVP